MILGVDPGLDGAFAFYDNGRVDTFRLPTVRASKARTLDLAEIARWLDDSQMIEAAFIERVHSMPKQGVASSFNFGRVYGSLLGLLSGFYIPTTEVTPQQWKRALGVPKDKDGARARASALFPADAGQWTRRADDGAAEAALLALYGARQAVAAAA